MTDPTAFADDAPAAVGRDPLDAYRSALSGYSILSLSQVFRAIEPEAPMSGRPAAVVEAIAGRVGEPRAAEALIAGLAPEPRLALGLFAMTETTAWPVLGMARALECLGVDFDAAVAPLLERGLLAVKHTPAASPIRDFARVREDRPGAALLAHSAAVGAARTVLPPRDGPTVAGDVRQVREADGLEPILRLSALWQRVEEAPLRQTQQGVLYKRDRERLEDDPVLAGPIADALEPLPDMVPLWIALARGVGLIAAEAGTDRVLAAPADYWAEHAVHLPQMIAAQWLGLRTWHEQGGMQGDGAGVPLALPFLRPSALLWLAKLGEGDWVALDDLAAHLTRLSPGWDRLALDGTASLPSSEEVAPRKGKGGRRGATTSTASPLASMLLGPAYVLGLVRAAEEVPSGRRVVQLTPLGRYALAIGPPAAPRQTFEQFLYVQPNFEIIAYRQGLTPAVIGQLSRFTRWQQLGAALELKLTTESVYRGLEGGLTPERMLERLGRHVARPLPAGVAEALRTWSGRRERVTYHAAATLIEFANAEDLQAILAVWPPDGRPAPVAVSERLLLVEDEAAVPFGRLRLGASRDYRRPPERCVEVGPDGVALALDVGRADLFVEAELARFADEGPGEGRGASALRTRRFEVTPASIARGVEDGLTPPALAKWFHQRAGVDLPAAIRLLLHAAGPGAGPLRATRPLVLHAPSAEVLDGLAQHPATREFLGERLGPTSVIVPDDKAEHLRRGLEALGLSLGPV